MQSIYYQFCTDTLRENVYKKYNYDMCIILVTVALVISTFGRSHQSVPRSSRPGLDLPCRAIHAVQWMRYSTTVLYVPHVTRSYKNYSKYFRTYSFWRVIVADPPSVINKSHCCWFHTFALRKCTKDFAHLGAGLHLKESFFARLFTTKRSGKQT